MLKINRYVFVVFLLIFIYLSAFSVFRINDADEGYILTGAMRILSGQLAYKDFFIHTPPVSYYTVALAFKIFGQQVIVARLLTAALGLFISIFLYLISLKVLPRRYALIPSVIFAFWGTGHVNYPSFAWFGLLFGLVGLYFFLSFLKSGKTKFIFLAGLSSGLSFLSKQNSGFCSLFVFMSFIAIDSLIGSRFAVKPRPSKVIKNTALLAGSFILPILAAAYLFYLNKGLPQFLYHAFVIAAKSGIERRILFPFPEINFPTLIIMAIYAVFFYLAIRNLKSGRRAGLFISGILLYLTILLGVIIYERTLPNFNIFLDYIKTGTIKGFFIFLASACAISIIIVFLKMMRRPYVYQHKKSILAVSIFAILYAWAGLFISTDMLHSIMSYPPAFIPAVYVLYQMRSYLSYKLKRPSYVKAISYFAVAMPILFIFALGIITNLNNETYRGDKTHGGEAPIYAMRYPLRIERAKGILVDKEESVCLPKVVGLLINKTKDGEKIFTPNFTCGDIYFLSNRLPASFFHFIHSDTIKLPDQQRIVGELRKDRVRYVFLETQQFEDIFEKGVNRQHILEVERLLRSNYTPAFRCGRYVVLAAK